jgi:hypothetical protein
MAAFKVAALIRFDQGKDQGNVMMYKHQIHLIKLGNESQNILLELCMHTQANQLVASQCCMITSPIRASACSMQKTTSKTLRPVTMGSVCAGSL